MARKRKNETTDSMAQSWSEVSESNPTILFYRNSFESRLRHWVKDQTFPQALLLVGQKGGGAQDFARFLSMLLTCQNHSPYPSIQSNSSLFGEAPPTGANTETHLVPCFQCSSCLQSRRGQGIDLMEIRAQDSDTAKQPVIRIDDIRTLQESVGFGPVESPKRLVLIHDAETMTQQAANSLLKILEEPPPYLHFLLTVSDSNLLLPTIRSRCQLLRLRPLPEEVLRQGLSSEQSALATSFHFKLAQGSQERLHQVLQPDFQDTRTAVKHFIEDPIGKLESLVELSSKDVKKLMLIFDQLEWICLDLLRWSVLRSNTSRLDGQNDWLNSDWSGLMRNLTERMLQTHKSPRKIYQFISKRMEEVMHARAISSVPLNRKLLIQTVLMPWSQATQ